jgi:hypothetical protein
MSINIPRAAKEMYFCFRINPGDLLGHGDGWIDMSARPSAGKVETPIVHRSSLHAL